MSTLREWFDKFTQATGEPVEWVVFGRTWEGLWWEDLPPEGHVTPYEHVAASVLDRAFESGYGENETPNLVAWSRSHVINTWNYDGMEGIFWLPKDPTSMQPPRQGGG